MGTRKLPKSQPVKKSRASSSATKKMRVHRRSPDEARQEIIDAARKYLSKNSFHSLTIDKLMERTKIGRTAFYAYFNDLYDLAEIFIHQTLAKVDEAVAGWRDINNQNDPIGLVQTGLRRGIKIWQDNGPLILALEQATAQDKKLRKIWSDGVAKGPILHVAEAIQRDQAAGLIGQLDPYAMSIALNRFNLTYLNDCFGLGHQTDPDVVLQTLERVWIGTLYGKLPASMTKRTNKLPMQSFEQLDAPKNKTVSD